MALSQRIATEERLARRVGARKTDLLVLESTCLGCAASHKEEERLLTSPPSEPVAMEAWLIRRLLPFRGPECACLDGSRPCSWQRHATLLVYSERLQGHLILEVGLEGTEPYEEPEPEGIFASGAGRGRALAPAGAGAPAPARILASVSLQWKEIDGEAYPIEGEDPKLEVVAQDLQLRDALHVEGAGQRLAALRALGAARPDDALVARETGLLLLEVGYVGAAEEMLKRSLALKPRQPELFRHLGSLCRMRGDDVAAVGHFRDAWELAPDASRLSELLAAALHAGRSPLVRAAALELLEEEEESVLARTGLALLTSAGDPDEAHDAWRALERCASRAGSRAVHEVATHAHALWTLPLPPWPPGMSMDTWRRHASESLEECGYSLLDAEDTRAPGAPAPSLEPGTPPRPELEVLSPDGKRWSLFLVESFPEPHVQHNLMVRIRSIREDAGREPAAVGLLCRDPLPWLLQLVAAGGTDARFLQAVEACTDPMLCVRDSAVGGLIAETERWYGEEVPVSIESLPALDRILRRLRFDGLGQPTWCLRCAVAAWLGALLEAVNPDNRWAMDADNPFGFRLSSGFTVNLVEAVGQLFGAPGEYGLHQLSSALLHRSGSGVSGP